MHDELASAVTRLDGGLGPENLVGRNRIRANTNYGLRRKRKSGQKAARVREAVAIRRAAARKR